MSRKHDSAEVTSTEEKKLGLGDPSEFDATKDDESEANEAKVRKIDRFGKDVTPIEGTSATNVGKPQGGGYGPCRNTYVGEGGGCGGELDEDRGVCKRCGIPTRFDADATMTNIIPEQGAIDGSQAMAHAREAARHEIKKEIVAAVCLEMKWDPDCLAEYMVAPPELRKKQEHVERIVAERSMARFRLAGLLPRMAY